MARPRGPIQHGTQAGYQKELRRGIPPCDPCREANAESTAAYREANGRRRYPYDAAYQRALARLREEYRDRFDQLLEEEKQCSQAS